MRTIVVVACHFADPQHLCPTTYARLKAAHRLMRPTDRILVTGPVPYKLGGPTLADLMKAYLCARGVPEDRVERLQSGVETFSEARAVCERHGGAEIVVVSSRWYFFHGMPIWRRRARENKVKISFHSLSGTGGWKTTALYAAIGLVSRTATLLGLERVLEKRLHESQQVRKQGFTMNGCA